MKMTTGYDFQGYTITEYYDVIFDEMLMGLGFGKSILSSLDNFASSFMGTEATVMVDKLNNTKIELRDRVCRKAERLGANALIGIDFESSKLGDIIMVSMTATAVRIEKNISGLPCAEKDFRDADEERQQRLKQERDSAKREMKDLEGIQPDEILDAVSQLEDAGEMYRAVEELSHNHPGWFSAELLENLSSAVNVGRLYGKQVGIEHFKNTLECYLVKNGLMKKNEENE